jgi:hypothetical protein
MKTDQKNVIFHTEHIHEVEVYVRGENKIDIWHICVFNVPKGYKTR